jgi:hypothetical protein
MKKGGRPTLEIDWSIFDKLCGLQCTLSELAGFFDCSEDTIERAVKREKKVGFADYYKKKSSQGKISLRRNQFRLAEKNATMAIWLGKQYLGQSDKQLVEHSGSVTNKNLSMRYEDYAHLSDEELSRKIDQEIHDLGGL